MCDGEMLLRAVLADPQDDTVRLAFADWLDENDEPERAELIRLQIKIVRESILELPLTSDEHKGLLARQYELVGNSSRPAPGVFFRLSRGLVYSMELPGDTWVRIAPAVAWHESQGRTCPRTAQPLESVTLTSWPTLARGPVLDEKSGVFRWVFEDDKTKATTKNTITAKMNDSSRIQRIKRLLKLRWKWIKFTMPRMVYLDETLIPVYRPSLTVRL